LDLVFSDLLDMSAFLSQDWDNVASFNTRQQVEIRDFSLGFIEKILQGFVIISIVFGVLIYGEGYYKMEESAGPVIASASGDAMGVSMGGQVDTRYFSAEDLTSSTMENGNLFIATKVLVQEQRRGICEDMEYPCTSADDCSKDVGAACSDNGFCVEPTWCPVSDAAAQGQAYKVSTQDMKVWLKSAVAFPKLEKKIHHTGFEAPILYPSAGYNTFTVKNFLLMCDPPVRFEEISELGAAIEVQIRWDCIVGNPFGCHPKPVRARRLDVMLDNDNIGFHFKHSERMGPDHREVQHRSGIRMYFKTVGHGQEFDLIEIMTKLATCLSLLTLAPVLTDLIMLRLYRQQRTYHARKYVISPDFSDLFEKIEGSQPASVVHLVEEECEDEEDKAMAEEDENWQAKMNETA